MHSKMTCGILQVRWGLVLLTLGVAMLIMGGCGSDSSSPEIVYDNDRLTGDYYVANYQNVNYVRFAEANFVGDGNLTFEHLINTEGPLESGSGTYTVRQDGRCTFGDDAIGMTNANGTVGSWVGIYPGDDNEFMVFIKASSGMSVASVAGEYYFMAYEGGNTVRFGEADFNGTDNVDFNVLVSSEGTSSGSDDYAVNADGSLTIGSDITGVVDATGNIITGIGVDEPGENEIIVMIKKSSGMTAAVLNGEYYLTNFFYGNMVAFGTVSFNGIGSATYNVIASSEDDAQGGTLPYTVSSSGILEIGDIITGAVSSDGNIAAAIELHDSDDNGIMVLIKKTP